jgi:hypothetical protein
LAGAFLFTAFFFAGAFLFTAFFFAGAFLFTAFFLAGAFLFLAAFFFTDSYPLLLHWLCVWFSNAYAFKNTFCHDTF